MKMKTNQYPGKLITFCGIDGCGKTTQIYNLKNFIEQQKKQVFLAEQSTGIVKDSEILRAFMDTSEHDAFDYKAASDRTCHFDRNIVKHLAEGDIVISDMCFYSYLANLRTRGYDEDILIHEVTKSIIKPDIAFFLDINIETAINRVRQREGEKIKYIDMDFQYTLRNEFLKLAKENEGIIITTDCSVKDSFSSILRVVLGTLNIDRRISNER